MTAVDVCPGSVIPNPAILFFLSFQAPPSPRAFISSHSAAALHPSLFQLCVGCFSPRQNQRRPAPVVLQRDAGAALLDQKLPNFQMAARSRVAQRRPSSIYRQRSADIRRNVGAALFDQKFHNFLMAALGRTAQRRRSPLILRLDVGAGSQQQLPHINVPILCGFLPYCGTEKTTDLEGVQIHAYNIDLCCIKKDSSTISNRNCKSTA